MVTICQTCGDRGFSVSFIYCEKCQDYAVHRYCLDVLPATFDEYVTWFCEDCKPYVAKQSFLDKSSGRYEKNRKDIACYVASLANKEMQLSKSSLSFHERAWYSEDRDNDWVQSKQQEMLLENELMSESVETCLDPEPLTFDNNHLERVQSKGLAESLLSYPTTKNKVRGTTKLLHLQNNGAECEVVKYNNNGQAIGKASVKMSSYIGVLSRSLVPITYKNWVKVPKELKDKIWSYVKRAYILDPKRKSSVLSSASISWRNFKNTLTTKYIVPYKDQTHLLKHPPERYNFIKQEHWDEFVRSRLSEEFLRLSQLQKERQAKNIYRHSLGRKGCARLGEELKRSSGMANEIDKSVLRKGHKNKKAKYVEKEVNESADKVVSQALRYEDSDRDWELLKQEEIMVFEDEQLNKSVESCLHHQPPIEPICSNNHSDILQSDNEESVGGSLLTKQTSREKKVRGPTKLLYLEINGKNPEVLKYNSKGQAIGKASVKMSSYLGVLSRSLVPITYKSWIKVPKELKDKLWSYVKRAYIVDPKRKNSVLSSASASWRNFKNTLTTKYIVPFKDQRQLLKHPPEDYNFIKQEHWDEFVRSRLSDEFLKLSQLQKERQAKNKYKHRLGRKGYARLQEEMKRSSGMNNEIDRSILWKEGHKNKKGEYVEKEAKDCADKIDVLTKLVQDGILAIAGRNDILSMALGTAEHSCRVRGMGHSITPKSYFGPSEHHYSWIEEEQKRMALQIETLQREVRALRKLCAKPSTSQHGSTSCSTSNVDDSQEAVCNTIFE